MTLDEQLAAEAHYEQAASFHQRAEQTYQDNKKWMEQGVKGWYTRTFKGKYVAIGLNPQREDFVFLFGFTDEEIIEKVRAYSPETQFYIRGIGEGRKRSVPVLSPRVNR